MYGDDDGVRKHAAQVGCRRRNDPHRCRRYCRDRDLNLRGVLIASRTLLQACITVGRLAAIAFVTDLCEGHGWRMDDSDAGLRNGNSLGEQQRRRKKATGSASEVCTKKNHVLLTSTIS